MLKRYAHNLSHTETSTIVMGKNYPCNVMEAFPGESFKITAKNLTRFMPQIAPTMADVTIGIDTYVIPWRQLFDKLGLDWDAYLTGGEDGADTSVLPTITIPNTGIEPGGLLDFLGYPTNYTDPSTNQKVIVGAGLVLNALPIVAYMHIINENYRDQNFVKKLDLTQYAAFAFGTYPYTDPTGTVSISNFATDGLFPKAWNRDYFGRALGNTQRGPVARLPLGTTAPVITGSVEHGLNVANQQSLKWVKSTDGTHNNAQFLPTVLANNGVTGLQNNSGNTTGVYPVPSNLYADLSNASAASIITFRLAARMQRFGEILQTSGARAVEFTMAMFGVRIPDARVQRPIFCGSFRLPVIFSEVLQTSATSQTSPQGNLAGHGITGGVNQPLHIKVIEHSYIMSIMHVMPRSQFQNTVPKYLLRSTRWDIPNPIFQHVGEQAVLRKEIYPNSSNPNEAFGYVPRYSELSSIPSSLHGHMKDTFLHWTMARVYSSEPVLSAAWRYEAPSNRSFAVPNADQMAVQIGFDIRARRVFAKNPTPGIHIV